MKDRDAVRDIPSAVRFNMPEFRKLNDLAVKRGLPYATLVRTLALQMADQIEQQDRRLAAHSQQDRAA